MLQVPAYASKASRRREKAERELHFDHGHETDISANLGDGHQLQVWTAVRSSLALHWKSSIG